MSRVSQMSCVVIGTVLSLGLVAPSVALAQAADPSTGSQPAHTTAPSSGSSTSSGSHHHGLRLGRSWHHHRSSSRSGSGSGTSGTGGTGASVGSGGHGAGSGAVQGNQPSQTANNTENRQNNSMHNKHINVSTGTVLTGLINVNAQNINLDIYKLVDVHNVLNNSQVEILTQKIQNSPGAQANQNVLNNLLRDAHVLSGNRVVVGVLSKMHRILTMEAGSGHSSSSAHANPAGSP